MLHLLVPRNVLDILQGLGFSARRHGGRGVVQIPDEYLGLGCHGGKQEVLERVEIQPANGSTVFVLMRNQSFLAGEKLGRAVDLQMSAFTAADDEPILMRSPDAGRAPDDFLESSMKREGVVRVNSIRCKVLSWSHTCIDWVAILSVLGHSWRRPNSLSKLRGPALHWRRPAVAQLCRPPGKSDIAAPATRRRSQSSVVL